jgi:hypothetical protein
MSRLSPNRIPNVKKKGVINEAKPIDPGSRDDRFIA